MRCPSWPDYYEELLHQNAPFLGEDVEGRFQKSGVSRDVAIVQYQDATNLSVAMPMRLETFLPCFNAGGR